MREDPIPVDIKSYNTYNQFCEGLNNAILILEKQIGIKTTNTINCKEERNAIEENYFKAPTVKIKMLENGTFVVQ